MRDRALQVLLSSRLHAFSFQRARFLCSTSKFATRVTIHADSNDSMEGGGHSCRSMLCIEFPSTTCTTYSLTASIAMAMRSSNGGSTLIKIKKITQDTLPERYEFSHRQCVMGGRSGASRGTTGGIWVPKQIQAKGSAVNSNSRLRTTHLGQATVATIIAHTLSDKDAKDPMEWYFARAALYRSICGMVELTSFVGR